MLEAGYFEGTNQQWKAGFNLKLTERGWAAVHALRNHNATGGSWSNAGAVILAGCGSQRPQFKQQSATEPSEHTEWVYHASDYRDFREKLERACKNLNGAAEANESNCALYWPEVRYVPIEVVYGSIMASVFNELAGHFIWQELQSHEI